MKVIKVVGDLFDIGSEIAGARSKNSEAGERLSPGEAARIAPMLVDLALDIAPAASADDRKALAAAFRAAADKLEAV